MVFTAAFRRSEALRRDAFEGRKQVSASGPNWSTCMSAWLRCVLWSTVVLTVTGPGAATAMAGPIEDCSTLPPPASVEACTQVIENKQERPAVRARALLLRARAALDRSDLDNAETDIRSAFALQPVSPFAYRMRGRLLALQGKNAEARADYAKAIQMSQTRVSKYASYHDRGKFLLQITELSAAQADFEAAIGLDPSKAAAYVGRALTNKAMGKIDEALADLDRAKVVEPNYWLTHVERGDILVAEKRFADAIAAYDVALTIRPDDARAVRGRKAASALVDANNAPAPVPAPATASPPPVPVAPSVAAPAAPTPSSTPPAQPAAAPEPKTAAPPTPSVAAPTPSPVPPAQPAAASEPQSPTPPPAQSGEAADPAAKEAADPAAKKAEERRRRLKEARDLRQKGNHQKAIEIYDALLRESPADTEAALEKARTLLALSKWEEALAAFKLVAESKTAPPKIKALAFEGMGETFVRAGAFALAIPSMTKALELNPKLPDALFWRGISEYQLGAFDKSIKDFQEVGSIVPKSPVYAGWEAMALVSAGDLPKAREAIDRAFAIQPDNVNALTARARLRLVTGEIDAAEADIAQLMGRGAPSPWVLETQQLIMVHKLMKPSDKPLAEATRGASP